MLDSDLMGTTTVATVLAVLAVLTTVLAGSLMGTTGLATTTNDGGGVHGVVAATVSTLGLVATSAASATSMRRHFLFYILSRDYFL